MTLQQKITNTTTAVHYKHLGRQLAAYFDAGLFCDVVFVFRGIEKIPAHRVIIATFSPVLAAKLERWPTKQRGGTDTIMVDSCTVETLRAIIQFCYTGVLPLSKDTAADVLTAADFYQMTLVKHKVKHFLLTADTIDVTNCVAVWRSARSANLEDVTVRALRVISRDLSQLTADVARLEVSCLRDLLRDLLRQVEHHDCDYELHVLDIIRHWTQRHGATPTFAHDLAALTSCVRFRNLREDAVLERLSSLRPVLSSSPISVEDCARQIAVQNTNTQIKHVETSRRSGGSLTYIAVLTKTQSGAVEMLLLDGTETIWRTPSKTKGHKACVEQQSAANLNGYLYTCGGIECGTGALSDAVEKYDPMLNQWSACCPLPTARYGHVMLSCGGRVYVMGGCQNVGDIVNDLCTTQVVCYVPEVDQWFECSDMPSPSVYMSAVVLEDEAVYTVDPRRSPPRVQRYSTTQDKWRTVESPGPYEPDSPLVSPPYTACLNLPVWLRHPLTSPHHDHLTNLPTTHHCTTLYNVWTEHNTLICLDTSLRALYRRTTHGWTYRPFQSDPRLVLAVGLIHNMPV